MTGSTSIMVRFLHIVALVWLTISVVGCARVKQPIVKPHSAEVSAVSATGLALKLNLDVTNPNRFPLTVRSVSGTVTLAEQVRLGDASAQSGVSIPAGETKRVSVQVTAAWTNLAQVATLASSTDPVTYRFDGKAKVGGAKLNVDVPFQLSGKLTGAELMQATMRSLPQLPGLIP